MKIIDAQPIPIYESKCPECKSVIRYKACEVAFCHITCPVCGTSLWATTISPVTYESPDVKEYVSQKTPLRCKMCSFFVSKDLMTGECSTHGGVWTVDDYCSKGAWTSNATN